MPSDFLRRLRTLEIQEAVAGALWLSAGGVQSLRIGADADLLRVAADVLGSGAGDSIRVDAGGQLQFGADVSEYRVLDALGVPRLGTQSRFVFDDQAAPTWPSLNGIAMWRRDISAAPTGVWPVLSVLLTAMGDNTTAIGGSGMFISADDRVGVVAATKGILYGLSIQVRPRVARANSPWDDVAGLTVMNASSDYVAGGVMGTDSIYVGHHGAHAAKEWVHGLLVEANCSWGVRVTGTDDYGVDVSGGTFAIAAMQLASGQAIRWDADVILAKDAAGRLKMTGRLWFDPASAEDFFLARRDGPIYLDIRRYSSNVLPPAIRLGKAYGTIAAPLAVGAAGAVLGTLLGFGHDGTAFQQTGDFQIVAAEAFTAIAWGTYLNFRYTPPSTVAIVDGMQVSEPADTETALLVRRNVAGALTLQRVSMGAIDSGGVGFKVLRVPN